MGWYCVLTNDFFYIYCMSLSTSEILDAWAEMGIQWLYPFVSHAANYSKAWSYWNLLWNQWQWNSEYHGKRSNMHVGGEVRGIFGTNLTLALDLSIVLVKINTVTKNWPLLHCSIISWKFVVGFGKSGLQVQSSLGSRSTVATGLFQAILIINFYTQCC